MDINNGENKILGLKLAKKFILGLVIVFIFDFFLFSTPALASAENDDMRNFSEMEAILLAETVSESLNYNPAALNTLPTNKDQEFSNIGYFSITAYTSEASQCDASPCITPNGFNLCQHGIEDTIAANFLPFGAKIKIPDLFGDRIFIVRDRMNARFQKTIDIWMRDKATAIKFGVKVA